MSLLPTTLGTRPRLAVEIRPEGVVAARAEDAQAVLSAVSCSVPAGGVDAPGLRGAQGMTTGDTAARRETIAAVRKTLEAVALKERRTTLVLPDRAVRVLLLDFDELPGKTAEALPIVRFRLKKLLPFDADDAVISYQVMSTQRGLVRVLVVAVPKDVLAEYEGLVREAGFEPGAVLPSTVAACGGLPEDEGATLVVNAGENSITTAIVQGGVLLLHRTVELASDEIEDEGVQHPPLPVVDRESTSGEWASQEPLNGYGVIDDDRISAEAAMEAERLAQEIRTEAEDVPLPREAMLPAMPSTADEWEARRLHGLEREMTQALSVAAAYFEDTLQRVPGLVLAAGTYGAEALTRLLHEAGFTDADMRVREMVEPAMLTGGALTSRVPRGWMAGVRGALRS